MPTHVTSIENAEHYSWGGADGSACDGWHLLKTTDLSVIEERMPAGTEEKRHYHLRARQFFYVLDGEMTMEVEGETFLVTAGQGLEIAPKRAHQAMNQSPEPLRMIVVSQPPSHDDRISA